VRTPGRTLVNYVSRTLTSKSGCTMRALRNTRIEWARREGHFGDHGLAEWDYLVAVCLLDRRPVPVRGARPVTAAANASAGRRRADVAGTFEQWCGRGAPAAPFSR
jgi:hypothetical protein